MERSYDLLRWRCLVLLAGLFLLAGCSRQEATSRNAEAHDVSPSLSITEASPFASSKDEAFTSFPGSQTSYPRWQDVAREASTDQRKSSSSLTPPAPFRPTAALPLSALTLPDSEGAVATVSRERFPMLRRLPALEPSAEKPGIQKPRMDSHFTERLERLPRMQVEPRPVEPRLSNRFASDRLHSDRRLASKKEMAPLPISDDIFGKAVQLAPRLTPRNVPMDAVNHNAEAAVVHAFQLASRGAQFAARVELIRAIRSVAGALDVREGTRRHSQALAEGLQALREVEDFLPRGSQLGTDLNIADLVSAHRTPLLKQRDLRTMTPLLAAQQYYTFARARLAEAVGNLPVGSKALYVMGRIRAELADQSPGEVGSDRAKAMVLYQAALIVDARNYPAANELGVLLARLGDYPAARRILLQAVSVSPQPETWRNLAVVHKALHEDKLARLAMQEVKIVTAGNRESVATPHAPQSDPSGLVHWLVPKQFSRVAGADTGSRSLPSTWRR